MPQSAGIPHFRAPCTLSYVKALLSMGKQGTKSFARDFFDTLIIITLPCEFANHRAGSQLKISGNSELPPAFIAILAGNQLHV